MRITPCPICGREPKIIECIPYNGIRRRICGCPKYDSVIPYADYLNRSSFIYKGDGDNNAIYKLWNLAIKRYKENKTKNWPERDWSHWSDNSHICW